MAQPIVSDSELTDLELAAWRGLLRVHAAIVKRLDTELLAGHGIPLSSYEVLIALQAAPERKLRMAELADRAVLSRSGMTRLVDRLEGEGLIARSHCAADARGWFAELTDAGEELLARARPAHLDAVRRAFLTHTTPDDLERLAVVWERVLSDQKS
jgi:DNA-binding MarR family transcriptional regulator